MKKSHLLVFSMIGLLALTGCGTVIQSTSGESIVDSSIPDQSEPSKASDSQATDPGSSQGESKESQPSQGTSQDSEPSQSSSQNSQQTNVSTSEHSWDSVEMPATQDIVIFCAKNTGYTHIYTWYNVSTPLTGAWPGTKMNDFDENWYNYTFPAPSVTAFNVIFNNASGSQTPDLKDIVSGVGYYWYTKADGFLKSDKMPDPGAAGTPQTGEIQTIEGPGDYAGGVDTASDYTKFTFWNKYPSDYWKCINKYGGSRKDFRQESIYFAITSRFYNGDASNDAECWDNKNNPASDPAWRGDFKGLIEKMDYIKALGFTAIWITPIVTNASGYDYHGYHSVDFRSVDPRQLSDDVSFQTVINEAHRRDMKICLDVVFNHTGNFGDETLFPMFIKDKSVDPDDMLGSMKLNLNGPLHKKYPNYGIMNGSAQYNARIETMKSSDGDPNDIYHHYGNFSWETQGEQVAQIAGDCVDLNTENPRVAEYLVDSYGQFIRMGVDAFRIDTMKHINRLTLNKYFFPALREYARRCRGDDYFFMFGEVCARVTELYNHGIPCLSPSFYTWAEDKNYAWGDKETNYKSAEQAYEDYKESGSFPKNSKNCYLNGTTYHAPDHSKWSGSSVIDFRMHRSFADVDKCYRDAVNDDGNFNDATYNVVYVDSHDYAPEPDEHNRPSFSEVEWAERLNLMFTFRGIPCLYYGSEIRFKAGEKIDEGPNIALENSGRAYFGEHLEGDVNVQGFGLANPSGKVASTLGGALAKHIQILNRCRLSCPALQMGQYKSVSNRAFIKRYTANGVDSVACVVMNGSANFSGLPNGTYVDLITGDTKTGSSFTASASGQGNIRIYVLNGAKIGGSSFAK